MRSPPTGEMTEKMLESVVAIFWPDDVWNAQRKFNYDPSNRRKYYKVDILSETRNLVWEYEGPDHYNNVWKLRRDEQRRDYFEGLGMTFLRWPYYCQLTRDIARYFFKEDYSEERYLKAIRLVYGVDTESGILAPGFHTTKHTPANFVAGGERRFLRELDEFPLSLKHQVVHSLKLYLQAVDDPYLVITETDAMRQLVGSSVDSASLNCYYAREHQ